MKRFESFVKSMLFLVAVAGFTGCGSAGSGGAAADADHGHEHSHEGVHGGHIIELGDEDYHAELIHDDATHKVGVYLLDGTAKSAAPIDAPSITINCCGVGDNPNQYTLVPLPQPGDPAGQASYFELVSEELVDGLNAEGGIARLNIVIAGKPYVGEIDTHHNDHGHDHDHK
ncbi:MAG: hypothetical protein WD468_12770 [Pirellulales bacterium]